MESDDDEQRPGRDVSLPEGPELFAMSGLEETNNDDPTPQDVGRPRATFVGDRGSTSIVQGCWWLVQRHPTILRFGHTITRMEWIVVQSLAHNPRTIQGLVQGKQSVWTRLGNFPMKETIPPVRLSVVAMRSGLEGMDD